MLHFVWSCGYIHLVIVISIGAMPMTSSYYTNILSITFVDSMVLPLLFLQIFTANPSTAAVKVTLPAMIDARFIRFHPLTYASAAYPCMKVEVYGCKP